MRHILKIFLLGFAIQNLTAQTASKINFDSIYKIINEKGSDFEYAKLLNKFQKGSVLSDEELLLFYYGFTSREEYYPVSIEEMELQKFTKVNGYGDTEVLEEKTFKSNPVSIIACFARAVRYGKNNDTYQLKIWTNNYNGLIRAILASGDGKTQESAFVTNSIADEYQILMRLKLNFATQINFGRYDGFELKEPNEFGTSLIYFDKIKIQEQYSNK